jgi:quercetin dioxygenase-like cupin family protein
MHHVGRLAETPARSDPYGSRSRGHRRTTIVDRAAGSAHQDIAIEELATGGGIDPHAHAFETALYVLEGELVVTVGGSEERLGADDVLYVDAGVGHAVENRSQQGVRWFELAAPQPANGLADPMFVADGFAREATSDVLCRRARFDESALPAPSSWIGLAGFGAANVGGAALQMLIDENAGASQLKLFVVQYQPGGFIREHDHPFEEAFFFVCGEVEALLDGETYTLRAGDYCWSSAGGMHALTNRTDAPVRWIETQVPQPPTRYQARFTSEWRGPAAD